MENIPIYTIGYGKRSIKNFIALLQKYHIQYLVDIRSLPFSKFNSKFSKAELEELLRQHGIKYMFMGDLLGGRPDDRTCYVDEEIDNQKKDHVDYGKVREKAFFQEGISRIRTAWDKQLPIALMCSEAKPEECHRSKLVGSTLVEQNITVAHIDEKGHIKTQEDVLPTPLIDEFNDKINFSSKKYTSDGRKKINGS